jgi:hypothetical protein
MSDKICLPKEDYFLLMLIFLLITIYFVYKFPNVDYNYGLNNNFSTLSQQVDIIDNLPIKLQYQQQQQYEQQQQQQQQQYQQQKQQQRIVNRKIKQNRILSKNEALKILTDDNTRITSNQLTDLQTQVLRDHPVLVADTQPRSLIINNPNLSLADEQPKFVLTNDTEMVFNQPTRVLTDEPVIISNPLGGKINSPLAVPDLEKRYALETRDVEAVFNDFKAPERRDQEYSYPTDSVKNLINVPTRGLPDNYHSVGVLVRKKDEKVLQLFGRQIYPGSSQWEYYVSGADNYGYPNKMPVPNRGNRELEDKQRVELPWLDKSKGNFEVNLYNFDVPRYNPFAL